MLQVEDPSKYGVVVMDESNLVDRFVEKPKASQLLLQILDMQCLDVVMQCSCSCPYNFTGQTLICRTSQ